ncbi:MAG: hypothetical protein IKC32_06690 [Clostridia bacterium]|nr:hypothetical protein [Clostridia bacterium]
MKILHKYVLPPLLGLLCFLFGAAIYPIAEPLVLIVFDYLVLNFPALFTRPSPISEPEAYLAMERGLRIVTVALITLVVTVFAMRLDNKRFEYLTRLTEGLYRIPERTVWYLKEFWITDLISAVFAPVVMVLVAYLVPYEYVAPVFPLIWCGGALYGYAELFPALAITVLISVVARLILIPSTLSAWRAAWISGDVG